MSSITRDTFPYVIVSNRLPVDATQLEDGQIEFQTAPGGLVSAMQAALKDVECAWVGWIGEVEQHADPFTLDRMTLVPLELNQQDIEEFYEGFSNDTLWPLLHDVTSTPEYNNEWWQRYVEVNNRFAQLTAKTASPSATVWIHDYQLMLVPNMLRALRPDLHIGFFLHVPFSAYEIFSQIPWRTQILAGMLGADVIGFQRAGDANNFRIAVEKTLNHEIKGIQVFVDNGADATPRTVLAREFPISIDTLEFTRLAQDPEVQARSAEIREGLGDPKLVMLGVDRLDYIKGIRHRLSAYGELLDEEVFSTEDVALVQVANPSRQGVSAYQQVREEIEQTVGRINGKHATLESTPIHYLHQVLDRKEMVALYLAADIMPSRHYVTA